MRAAPPPIRDSPITAKPRSVAMVVAGSVLTLLGLGGIAGGAAVFAGAQDRCEDARRDSIGSTSLPVLTATVDACGGSGATVQVAGITAMAVGGSLVLSGVPLIVVGAVPARPATVPALSLEPGMVRLRWSF
jgi:hypothetical protein